MRARNRRLLTGFALAALTLLAALPARAQTMEMIPRVDQFIVFVDCSGSMKLPYPATGQTRIDTALEVLRLMNQEIPELGYSVVLAKFAKFEILASPSIYNRMAFGQALGTVPTDFSVWGNPTPLGDGLYALAPTIAAMPGRTAVILVTDGDQNTGDDPIEMARRMDEAYNICFHVVNLSTDLNGQRVLDAIEAINPCSIEARAEDLLENDGLRADFIERIFYDMRMVAPPPPPPAPEYVLDTVTLSMTIEFESDKAEVRQQYMSEIAEVAEFMQRYPNTTAEIVGYCDSTASYFYNLRLSRQRAESVRDILVNEYGIAPARLDFVGYGTNFPVGDNATPEGRQLNRRVDAVITGTFIRER